ncbi:two component transcriptional regulator, LuxR family [Mycolicibacterium rhodesiae JS60]|nr:two component transcriptional regulator, LuxR family [Mycolicibacterium rhodesiae JS60]
MRNSDETSPIPVVVIDAHAVVHAGLRQWFADEGGHMHTVGAYLSVHQFLTEHDHSGTPRPVLLYDPEDAERPPNYLALQRLRTLDYPVIAYSRMCSSEVILTCLDHGAVSYLVKSEPAAHLLDAVAAAWTGRRYVGPSMAAAMHRAEHRGRPGLTAQERRVLLAWLHTDNKETVAKRLHIAPSTVKTHLQRIRHRYATAGRPARAKVTLFARAVQDGLISVHEL